MFFFDKIFHFLFSVNPILGTTCNARIPTVQSAVPVPLRPSAADWTVLIRDGQYPSNARTIHASFPFGGVAVAIFVLGTTILA